MRTIRTLTTTFTAPAPRALQCRHCGFILATNGERLAQMACCTLAHLRPAVATIR